MFCRGSCSVVLKMFAYSADEKENYMYMCICFNDEYKNA